MKRYSVTTKIWLSVGVFLLGYILSVAFGQIPEPAPRTRLVRTDRTLFPSAQKAQAAEAAFQRMTGCSAMPS